MSSLLGIGDAIAGSGGEMKGVFVKVSIFNLVYFKTSSFKMERILSITVFCWLLFSMDIQEHNWLMSWLKLVPMFGSFFGIETVVAIDGIAAKELNHSAMEYPKYYLEISEMNPNT